MDPTTAASSPAVATALESDLAPAPDRLAFEQVLRAASAAPGSSRGATVTLGEMLGSLASRFASPGGAATSFAAAPSPPGALAAGGPALSLEAVVPGRVSSEFGMRHHPITGVDKMHNGVDVAAPAGTPIRSAASGVVSFAGNRGGYGLLVIVDHGDGVETRYAHQQQLDVRAGDRVEAGQVLGAVGATGLATGPHLHFEVRRDGNPVDPVENQGAPPWTH